MLEIVANPWHGAFLRFSGKPDKDLALGITAQDAGTCVPPPLLAAQVPASWVQCALGLAVVDGWVRFMKSAAQHGGVRLVAPAWASRYLRADLRQGSRQCRLEPRR